MSFKSRLNQVWDTANTLDEQIYLAVLLTGTLNGLCSLAAALIQQYNIYAVVCIAVGAIVFCLLTALILQRHSAPYRQRLALVCVLNFFYFPVAFFIFGGLNSGIELFYLLGLFCAAVLLRGRARNIVFFLALAEMILTLLLVRPLQQHLAFLPVLTEDQKYQSSNLSLLFTALSLATLTVLILKAYDSERSRNLDLMERLRGLSTRDALSGLYNRRELSRRLDLVYKAPKDRSRRDEHLTRENCYIAMFDIDDFKRLNDTYGHQFGDTVLSKVSQMLGDAVNLKAGELAARYGGEEFVCVLYADSTDEAYQRTDAVRQAIAALTWEISGLTVTISGGLVSCEVYDQLKQAMLAVDKLLYQAKHNGKNQIAIRFDDDDGAAAPR